jgi:hypothetical protein
LVPVVPDDLFLLVGEAAEMEARYEMVTPARTRIWDRHRHLK